MRAFRYTGDHATRTLGYDFAPGEWVQVDGRAAEKLAANDWFEEQASRPKPARKPKPRTTRAPRRKSED